MTSKLQDFIDYVLPKPIQGLWFIVDFSSGTEEDLDFWQYPEKWLSPSAGCSFFVDWETRSVWFKVEGEK